LPAPWSVATRRISSRCCLMRESVPIHLRLYRQAGAVGNALCDTVPLAHRRGIGRAFWECRPASAEAPPTTSKPPRTAANGAPHPPRPLPRDGLRQVRLVDAVGIFRQVVPRERVGARTPTPLFLQTGPVQNPPSHAVWTPRLDTSETRPPSGLSSLAPIPRRRKFHLLDLIRASSIRECTFRRGRKVDLPGHEGGSRWVAQGRALRS
jgi:hypothetical protein